MLERISNPLAQNFTCYFSAKLIKNTRKYTKYLLRFLKNLTKKIAAYNLHDSL